MSIRRFLLTVSLCLSSAVAAANRTFAADSPEKPVPEEVAPPPSTEAAAYIRLTVEGWTVRLDDRLHDGGEYEPLGQQVLALLGAKLAETRRLLPESAVKHLVTIPIWIEYDNSRAGRGCCYHPSAAWLRSHHFNADKAKGIEVSNAQNFIGWSHDQPAAILHEFAHAWHDQVLGWDEPRVKSLFQSAVDTGRYNEVLHISGRKQRHYALNNHKEYFAEMSEALFWTNDFYPFVRAELREVDPGMYELLLEVWKLSPR